MSRYNMNIYGCEGNKKERFDGVAVNNEKYGTIKCDDLYTRQGYLNNLQQITIEAAKQINGRLRTHYSMGWHWGRCGGTADPFIWNGSIKPANHHMIDIFDSIDVQVKHVLVICKKNWMVRCVKTKLTKS